MLQLGLHLLEPDRMESREWRGVAEPAEYRPQRSHATARRGRDIFHPDRNGSIRAHKILGAPHIGGDRTKPALTNRSR
jgi:hypothetical protein